MNFRKHIIDAATEAIRTTNDPFDARECATAALTAAWDAAVVCTVEDLDALPVRSVVWDAAGLVAEKYSRGRWRYVGSQQMWETANVRLPAHVLHHGIEGA